MLIIVGMHLHVIPNRGRPATILLRESFREGKQVHKRTLANLSTLPPAQLEALRRTLKGERLVPVATLFEVSRSAAHGHVHAVLMALRRLGLPDLLASRPSRSRALVLAMVAARLVEPNSKLATTRWWHTTTLADTLGVTDATEEELYDALDWLLARQDRIEAKLAARHLTEGGLVLYDVSSSYYEGRTCALARFGHDRDGRTGCPIIVYGVLTDADGRPVAMEVYPGNTGDSTTVPDQVEKLRERFKLSRVVLVGDRGMLTEPKIAHLKTFPGLGWISALTARAIRALVDQGPLQRSLFDQTHLAEITAPEYPGERLVACFNPLLAEERKRKREALLQATERALTAIQHEVTRRTKTPLTAAEIGVKVGKIVNRFKVAKHFALTIKDGAFAWARRTEAIRREAELDGIYVIRTSEPKERLSPEETVRSYKRLAAVERAFRTLKGLDLRVRPIFHRTEAHVTAHFFLCLLAYYVEWHMRDAWRPLLFADEDQAAKHTRDPIAPATRSEAALHKVHTRVLDDGTAVHSFPTLLKDLSTIVRNVCRRPGAPSEESSFDVVTTPTVKQQRAYELLEAITV